MSAKDIIEKVVASDPIDSAAKRVTSRGVHWEPRKVMVEPLWENCPPLRSLKGMSRIPSFQNLTGSRFGFFVVVGLLKDGNHKWVVRCNCGKYTVRSPRSVRNPNNKSDCCERCQALFRLKSKDYWKRTGDYVTREELMGIEP